MVRYRSLTASRRRSEGKAHAIFQISIELFPAFILGVFPSHCHLPIRICHYQYCSFEHFIAVVIAFLPLLWLHCYCPCHIAVSSTISLLFGISLQLFLPYCHCQRHINCHYQYYFPSFWHFISISTAIMLLSSPLLLSMPSPLAVLFHLWVAFSLQLSWPFFMTPSLSLLPFAAGRHDVSAFDLFILSLFSLFSKI